MAKISKWFKHIYMCIGSGACSLAILSNAYADDCNALNQNEEWKSKFTQLSETYQKEAWRDALRQSSELESICSESPALNYMIAHIHKNLGNNEKYLFYLQKSTQNTERFGVEKNMLDQIWSEKYIAVHPEAAPETIKQRESDLRQLSEENTSLKDELRNLKLSAGKEGKLESIKSTSALLWTSVGVSGVGLALTAAGAVLISMNNDKAINADRKGYNVKRIYNTGWALTGAGIGMTILGAAASGYFGYQYKKLRSGSDEIALSFTLLPSYSLLTLDF